MVLHAKPCKEADEQRDDVVPSHFAGRRADPAPVGRGQRMAYAHCRLIEQADDIDRAIADLLDIDDIVFVHARNVLSGCYSCTAARRGDYVRT